MESINDALAAVLQNVRTPGDFYATGHCALHVPLIEVEGAGPIALPLLPAQAAQLIAVAERAPYGRGGDTLVDTSVRRTWQIGADRVRIEGKHWAAMMDSVVERAARGLGAGAGVVAELYKLLIYDEGSFFVSHRDTEKSAGMFATLIIALPSLHSGGALSVRHREREVQLDLRGADFSEMAWAAFYADCVHEVLPVTSGCRSVLVYNLLRPGKGRLPRPPSYDQETAAISQLLRQWSEPSASMNQDLPAKLVYPLEHAYTPAELSFAALKGADAAAASVLTAATHDAACDLHAALMRIEESGAAEYSGYSRSRHSRRYHDDDDEDQADEDECGFTVAEVFDRALTLSHWRRPDGVAASLGTMPFTDVEVCPGDALADMDPDEQHFEEATGNEGASFERSYQRAALVLWPQAQKLQLLARAGFGVSLPMLGSLVSAWVDEGAEADSTVWREARALAAQMLACWPVRAAAHGSEGPRVLSDLGVAGCKSTAAAAFSPSSCPIAGLWGGESDKTSARWGRFSLSAPQARQAPSAEAVMLAHLTRMRDLEHIDAMLAGAIAAGAYAAQDNETLVQALKLLPPVRVGILLLGVVRGNAVLHIAGCADLLARAAAVAAWRGQLQPAVKTLLDAMPGDPSRPQAQAEAWRRERADAAVVHDTLRALVHAEHADLAQLADQAVTHWLAWPKTFGLDTVIVPALRILAERPVLMSRPACKRLQAAALAHLQARVSLDLAPPSDWRRDARMSCRCEHCQSLSRFLGSADEEVWRFKAREADRRHVEDSIRQGRHDVDCSTERKGSPHVLVCTKNQASYERRVAQRRADLDNLTRLKA